VKPSDALRHDPQQGHTPVTATENGMNSFGRNYYYWRRLGDEDRQQVLALRQAQHRPWHSVPHATTAGRYILTGACYEHAPVVGATPERLACFESALLDSLDACAEHVHAWVVLPNHYHALVTVVDIEGVLTHLARLHGRMSYQWNGEDRQRGRKVWCGAVETQIRNERHFRAALNYVHHNPVKHGYVRQWTEWPCSSAVAYLDAVGRDRAAAMWREYDISGMGTDWDP
jgi:putative transposase